MSQLKVACAGTGYFAQFHYDGWSRLPVDLVGCCSLDDAARAEVAGTYQIPGSYSDFEIMLDETKPDLVDIITPPPTHKAFVTAAMARGIPVICQKPLCTSLAEAEALAADIAKAGATVIVHENFRFQPWHLELKRLIDQGLVGEIYQVSFRLRPGDGQGPDAYLSRQPYFQKMPRFLVHETAIHLIDVFRYFLGEVTQVTAELRQLNPVISGEDAGIIIFDFEDGRRGLFDGNRLSDHVAENRRLTIGEMLIEGAQGTLNLNGDGEIQFRKHGENVWQPHAYSWENAGFAGDSVYRLQAHVLDHLIAGTQVHNTAADYLINLQIEDAVYRSSDQGRRILL
ncbi:MAG: Gfo/Idh/MocA family oxidoreductase [Alphaproteobacteria bacterium]|nr:Gfo/Idh/MocA family oxidoreductase [Alphaproteobacteria bacterium]